MGHIEGLRQILSLSDEGFKRLSTSDEMEDIQILNAISTAQIIIDHVGGNTIADLRRLKLIDVGCGGDGPDLCPPFFCILAGMYGAEAYGIDLFPYSGDGGEFYTHRQLSLLECLHRDGKIDLRAITGQNACDVVVCTGLAGELVSPTLEGILKVRKLEMIMPVLEKKYT